jgi:putative membrane protein
MVWHDSWGYGQWIGMSLMMVLFWVVVVGLVVWVVRSTRPVDSSEAPRSPYDILAERFARGEIDEDEFTRRRDLIQRPRGT